MITIVSHVGRLLEIRCHAPLTVDDVATLVRDIHAWLDRLGQRSLACADLRQMGLVDPQLIDKVVAFMRAENPRVERSAFLMDDRSGALQTMQLERMLKEGRSSARRLFKVEAEAVSWLGELCTPAELTRLRAFLSS